MENFNKDVSLNKEVLLVLFKLHVFHVHRVH